MAVPAYNYPREMEELKRLLDPKLKQYGFDVLPNKRTMKLDIVSLEDHRTHAYIDPFNQEFMAKRGSSEAEYIATKVVDALNAYKATELRAKRK